MINVGATAVARLHGIVESWVAGLVRCQHELRA